MDERAKFAYEAFRASRPFAELCREFGVSRRVGYKWVNRYKELGEAGLEDESRAPRSNSRAVSDATIELLLETRRERPTWGPRKLVAYLRSRRRGVELPAASTVGEILARYGLVKPRRRRQRTPPSSRPFAQITSPNDLWCVDFKGHFALAGRERCHPLTITDAHTRFLLTCRALRRPEARASKLVVAAAFREYGLPRTIRSDNGQPFASIGAGGLSSLSVWFVKLGIALERIDPGRPYQNGRHERMHLTLLETVSPPACDQRAQQRRFNEFQRIFNYERPHEALGQMPPASTYVPSRRAAPRNLLTPDSPDYPAGFDIRRVDQCGVANWKNRRIYVSSAVAGEPVGFEEIGNGLWRLYFGFVPLGTLDEARLELGLIRPRRRDPRRFNA